MNGLTSKVSLDVEYELQASIEEGGQALATHLFRKQFGDQNDDDYYNWGTEKFILKSDIPKDASALFITAKIAIITDSKVTQEQLRNTAAIDQAIHQTLVDAMSDRKITEAFSDFTIVTRNGVRLPCSKIILAARSPVFKAMLEAKDSAEARSDEVVIPEFGAVTLTSFLEFLITDTIRLEVEGERGEDEANDLAVVQNLYLLGDKYDVKNLVEEAKAWLEREMTPTSVLGTLKMAHMVSSESLVNICLGYIVRNRKKDELSTRALKASKLEPELWSKILDAFW